jgi:hypothetical protein
MVNPHKVIHPWRIGTTGIANSLRGGSRYPAQADFRLVSVSGSRNKIVRRFRLGDWIARILVVNADQIPAVSAQNAVIRPVSLMLIPIGIAQGAQFICLFSASGVDAGPYLF